MGQLQLIYKEESIYQLDNSKNYAYSLIIEVQGTNRIAVALDFNNAIAIDTDYAKVISSQGEKIISFYCEKLTKSTIFVSITFSNLESILPFFTLLPEDLSFFEFDWSSNNYNIDYTSKKEFTVYATQLSKSKVTDRPEGFVIEETNGIQLREKDYAEINVSELNLNKLNSFTFSGSFLQESIFNLKDSAGNSIISFTSNEYKLFNLNINSDSDSFLYEFDFSFYQDWSDVEITIDFLKKEIYLNGQKEAEYELDGFFKKPSIISFNEGDTNFLISKFFFTDKNDNKINVFSLIDNEMNTLKHLSSNYYREIGSRGTSNVFRDDIFYKGEISRLICRKPSDKYFNKLLLHKNTAWFSGGNSPLYKGLRHVRELNIMPSFEKENKWSFFNKDYVSFEDGVYTISQVPNQEVSGLGNSEDFSKAQLVSSELSYEIVADIKLTSSSTFPSTKEFLNFGIYCFDKNNNLIDTIEAYDGTISNFFLSDSSLLEGKKVSVRGVLNAYYNYQSYNLNRIYQKGDIVVLNGNYYFCKKETLNTESPNNTNYWREMTAQEVADYTSTNLKKGDNLVMPKETIKVIPFVHLTNENSLNSDIVMNISRLSAIPISLPYSLAIPNTRNLMLFFYKNNSESYGVKKVNEIMNKYLLPYNIYLKDVDLSPKIKTKNQFAGDFNNDFNNDFNK